MPSLWHVFAFGLIPLSIIELVLAMSGVKFIQKAVFRITSAPVHIGPFACSLNLVTVLATASVLSLQTWKLSVDKNIAPGNNTYMYATADRALMKGWRLERNWWISLFTVVLWLLVWRVSVMARYFIARIESLETTTKDNKRKSKEGSDGSMTSSGSRKRL
eukprot:Platyproteum_vivax@DN6790_c0_g1_i2.p1